MTLETLAAALDAETEAELRLVGGANGLALVHESDTLKGEAARGALVRVNDRREVVEALAELPSFSEVGATPLVVELRLGFLHRTRYFGEVWTHWKGRATEEWGRDR